MPMLSGSLKGGGRGVGALQSLLLAAMLLSAPGCRQATPPPAPAEAALPAKAPDLRIVESEHFSATSTADAETTERALAATEALFQAYTAFFPEAGDRPDAARMHLRLYATRDEFQANNRSRPWAEGYYYQGTCHAYLDPAKANPFHWLLHEAVHQLNREVTGYASEKWINEGIATYFSTSRYADGRLEPGVPDLDTYPLWWLKRWTLSGDWDTDVSAGRIIPLRALITGQGGPPIDATVNAHYLGYWSLTHFLLHHDGGKHAQDYRWLARHGGTLADFEARMGPVAQVQREWYAYLLHMAASARGGPAGDGSR